MNDNTPKSCEVVDNVTLAGGGNETFAALTRRALNGTYAVQFADAATGGIAANTTINLEVSLDGTNWETMTDHERADHG